MFSKKKLEMFEDQYGLHFSFSWMTTATYFLAFFAVFWNSFLLFWYGSAFATGAPMLFFLFPLLHVLAGIAITYFAITNFFNKTKIDLIGDQLTIKHGPIPWFKGDQEVNINDIQQFYVKEISKKNDDTVSFNYGVWAMMRNGTRLDLTKGVNMESDYALIVEQKLENYLGIQDQPVKGAYGNVKYHPINHVDEIDAPLDLDDFKNRAEPEIEKRKNWDDEQFV